MYQYHNQNDFRNPNFIRNKNNSTFKKHNIFTKDIPDLVLTMHHNNKFFYYHPEISLLKKNQHSISRVPKKQFYKKANIKNSQMMLVARKIQAKPKDNLPQSFATQPLQIRQKDFLYHKTNQSFYQNLLITKNNQNINKISNKPFRQTNKHKLLSSSQPNQEIKRLTELNKYFHYVAVPGNSQKLIKLVMSARPQWTEVKSGQSFCHFKWALSSNISKNYKYGRKRLFNHFEGNQQITNKNNLIKNLQIFSQTNQIQLFSITPLTFQLDLKEDNCEYNLKQFLNFFMKNHPDNKMIGNQLYKKIVEFITKFKNVINTSNSQIKKRSNVYSKLSMMPVYGNNFIWLLKPIGLNRGRGIQIFSTLQEFQTLLTEQLLRFEEQSNKLESKSKKVESLKMNKNQIKSEKISKKKLGSFNKKMRSQKFEKPIIEQKIVEVQQKQQRQQKQQKQQVIKPVQSYYLKSLGFVIQKYIQKPLLINDRKFDIRIFVLLTPNLQLFICKEGYLRTSSYQFSLQNTKNYLIHLTNSSFQKYFDNYGSYQQGNVINFSEFVKIIEERKWPIDFYRDIMERIKQLCFISMSSVKKKIDPHSHRHSFQIFGYDFIIDEEFKVWLIEVNNNPSLQQQNPYLKQFFPRMIHNAFQLTIDKIFFNCNFIGKKQQQIVFKLKGYKNEQQIWQSLGTLKPNEVYKKSVKQ